MSSATVLIVGACAVLIGYCVNQGGTCAVAGAKDLVHRRQVRVLLGFAIATGAASLVALPAAWATGNGAHLPGNVPVDLRLIAAASLLAVGALINDACLLGSLWRLGNGELRLLALPFGLALGFELAALGSGATVHPTASRFAHADLGALAVVVPPVVIAGIAWWWLNKRKVPGERWSLPHAMALLGVCGALLYVLQPGWSYADVVHHRVVPLLGMMTGGETTGVSAAVLTIGGAALSAIRLRVFRPALPSLSAVLRTIMGGTLMGFAATMVPGGNDSLLLSAVPAGSLSGAVAYTVMTLVVILLSWAASAAGLNVAIDRSPA